MIDRLVIFGGTGDLTGRYLLPGLATLLAGGHLSEGFEVVGASREEWSDEQFRNWAADWLGREAGGVDAGARAALVNSLRYRRIDLADQATVTACTAGEAPVAVYLALPPAVFPTAVTALHQAGLPADSQVVFEKPFGEDHDSARTLNRLVAELVDERHAFRVDHFLAMTTVQNVLGTRLANRVLEPIWNSAHIEEIEVIWEESLALEGRAGYYDHVGALKDMVQNHLLQVLCLVAMEPPISLGERDLRDRKVDVLRSVRPLEDDDVAARSRRARYRAGRVGDRQIPAYVDEHGVTPEHGTETFAEVTLQLDSWRWSGTNFRLRTGKAMGADHMEVLVHFRPVPHLPFEHSDSSVPNRLRFGLEPEGLALELTGTGPGAALSLVPLTLSAEMEPPELPAYGRILLDVLRGNSALSIRADEAEEAWRVVTPVLDGWSRNLAPLEEYDAGSTGPPRVPDGPR
ncbi:MAG: glucose-6-phosphate dehydrogenase [Candidatus Dormibacteraeota bacterium]|nr:glucose-6-phosphate dehydrogenase [Candidatus Dormibacteraeota bacterium]